MKAPSRNSIFLDLNSNRARTLLAVLVLAVILGGAGWAQAVPISVKLTADALGLGSSDINRGGTVDPDMPGFFTSTTTGEGSVLTIQKSGLAGPGTVANPLFVTVTARTHLDTVNYPLFGGDPRDYQAGVLFISEEKSDLPDGKNEGLGVRAFKVDKDAYRTYEDGKAQLDDYAEIEGSKDVSGGTGPVTFDPDSPNGAPHVDESVTFDFVPQFYANALSVEVLLSKFDLTNIIDLRIKLTSGSALDFYFLQTTDTSIFEPVGATSNNLWKLKFSGLSGLGPGDLIDNFIIRANDDDPQNPRGTAEHFLITGITATPEPATVVLLGMGGLALLRKRRG